MTRRGIILYNSPILASPAWKRHLGGEGREERLKSIVCDSEAVAPCGVIRIVLLGEDASDKGVTRRFCPVDSGRAGVRGATGDMANTSRPAKGRDKARDAAILEVIETLDAENNMKIYLNLGRSLTLAA
jgi:hypothetical protein